MAAIKAGKSKPGGITKFEKRNGKDVSIRWRSLDEMIVEAERDPKTEKWTEIAKYPGKCFWCAKKKEWLIGKK